MLTIDEILENQETYFMTLYCVESKDWSFSASLHLGNEYYEVNEGFVYYRNEKIESEIDMTSEEMEAYKEIKNREIKKEIEYMSKKGVEYVYSY